MPEVKMPSLGKMQWLLFLLSTVKIPMIGFVRPKLEFIDAKEVRVRIKLRMRTKNHLNSMYFGALAVGADVAGGIHTFYHAASYPDRKLSFAFKSMHADFLKRAETEVVFVCNEGDVIQNAIDESVKKSERINSEVTVFAKDLSGENVAIFKMGVSVKMN
jgi:acyl-coenzyme A thioesterase PaaI-like protein